MEHKHTLGPWGWVGDNSLWAEGNIQVLGANDDKKPYGMHSAIIEHVYDEEVKEANKCLIAAAPDLLSALELMLVCVDDEGDANQIPFKQARAAIAKAKGTQS